jgi:hypothetical protein
MLMVNVSIRNVRGFGVNVVAQELFPIRSIRGECHRVTGTIEIGAMTAETETEIAQGAGVAIETREGVGVEAGIGAGTGGGMMR